MLPLVPRAELLQDPGGGRLSVSQVSQARGWRVMHQSALVFGFSRSAYWVRWRLHNAADVAQNPVVDLGNARQDRIEWRAWRGDGPAPAKTVRSGYRLSFSQRPMPSRQFAFPLHLAPLDVFLNGQAAHAARSAAPHTPAGAVLGPGTAADSG